MLLCILLFLVPTALAQGGCGTPRCGGGFYPRPYLPPLQQYPQQYYEHSGAMALPRPAPQMQPQQMPVDTQMYYTASYVQPTQVLAAVADKDLTTPQPPPEVKISEYEKFEEKLGQLKGYPEAPLPAVVEPQPQANITSLTYIRELQPASPYAPQPYLPRPMPYRPHPLLPKGCPVLPPQYMRPMPFMPRGYVTPVPMAPQPYPNPIPQPVPPPMTQPLPQPLPQPVYPPQVGGYARPPPLNDCCGRCASICRSTHHKATKAQAKASKTVEKNYIPLRDTSKDPRCSSEELRDIMTKGTTRTTDLSKRIIQKAAEEQLGGMFSVICSREDFSYVARSEIFCQTSKNDIICYAFQHN